MSADKITRLAIGCRCLPKCLHYPHYPVMSASVSFDRDLERREAARRFLVERIDYERTQSMPCSEEAFKLDRMRELLRLLGNPYEGLPIVHVAGTKGKGSTSAMMAAVLSAAGFRTGLFTSPHLDRVEERMAIDGRPCSAEEFVELIEQVRPAVDVLDRVAADHEPPEHGPTYFEIVTAMALCHFARRQVDAAVLEVGLGGRLDSTNVCTPRVSIITSISFDHTKQLGETLAAIAAEKAGIIKPGVPVVSGVTDEEPREVIRRIARECGSRLVELGVDFDFDYQPPRHLERRLRRALRLRRHRAATPGSRAGAAATADRGICVGLARSPPGRQRGDRAGGGAGTASGRLDDPEAAVRRGLAEVVWPARVEMVGPAADAW